MSHLDEGTLHALLDGELDLAEVREVQKHLGSCVACGSRLQEVKQVLAEADRLVGAMEVPAAGPVRRQAEPPRSPPPFRSTREPEVWDEPPVLLVPDPIDANSRRKRWMRGLRWAAAILIVVTGTKLAGNVLRPSHPVLSERDLTSATPAVPPTVVSPEETRRPESTLATRNKAARPEARAPVQRAEARAAQVVEEPAADTGEPSAGQGLDDSAPAAAPDSVPEGAQQLAADTYATDSVSQPVGLAAGAARDTTSTEAARDANAERPSEADLLATRRAAAAALEELDRQRRRERANAATAALPPATRPDVAAPADAAPRPLTLEQRAQIYLRIGLDEAVKHLGGPVHVIEGMTPELIGLTRAQLIPGSSSNRPVVRVVYLDTRGRLILLDQQRMVGDQAPSSPAGSLRWSIGDVMLYLRGEPSPEVLRSLQARVR